MGFIQQPPAGSALVQHVDGTYTVYNATANTNAARGTALQTAKTAAVSGETIFVGAGTYDTRDLLKNGVNWHFVAGAIINYTGAADGAIFDDSATGANAAITCTIFGFGQFSNAASTAGNTSSQTFLITNASSNITVYGQKADNTSAATSGGITVSVKGCANASFIFDIIDNNSAGAATCYWENGACQVRAQQILKSSGSGAGYAVYGAVTTTPTGEWYVSAERIWSNLAAQTTVSLIGSNGTQRMWVRAATIENAGAGSALAISNGGGLLYVVAEKIIGQVQTSVTGSANTLYVNTQKHTSHGTQPLVNNTQNTMFYHADHADDSAHASAPSSLIKVAAGTLYASGKLWTRTTNGDGVAVSGGTCSLGAVNITTASAQNDLNQTGGTLNVMPGTLYDPSKTSGTVTFPYSKPIAQGAIADIWLNNQVFN